MTNATIASKPAQSSALFSNITAGLVVGFIEITKSPATHVLGWN